jgi:hypothetical protein
MFEDWPACIKQIKVTKEFAQKLEAEYVKEIIYENTPQGHIAKFTGIPIIIDDTLKKPYVFVL